MDSDSFTHSFASILETFQVATPAAEPHNSVILLLKSISSLFDDVTHFNKRVSVTSQMYFSKTFFVLKPRRTSGERGAGREREWGRELGVEDA